VLLFINYCFLLRTIVNPSACPIKKTEAEKERLTLPNLKRSGFVFIFAEPLVYHLRTKRSAAVFLMSEGLRKGTSGIDKHFLLLLMPQK